MQLIKQVAICCANRLSAAVSCRVMFSEGVSFVGLRPSEQADWEAEKEALPAGAGLSIFCYRKPGSTGDR